MDEVNVNTVTNKFFNFEIWQWVILILILLPSSIIDIKRHEIIVWPILVGFPAGLLLRALLNGVLSVPGYFVQFLPGIAILITARLAKGCIGFGDGLMCIFIGSVLSVQYVISSIFVGFVLAALWGLYLLIVKKAGRKYQLPFMPFLFGGVLICGFL